MRRDPVSSKRRGDKQRGEKVSAVDQRVGCGAHGPSFWKEVWP